MIYGSVCSGVEAATVAWHGLGWKPAWFSQYDPEHNYKKRGPDFPSLVLAHHYPHVPNLGDMLKIEERPEFDGTINLLVGGTPCQSFSIAGLRQGLDDSRGNLALKFCQILKRKQPRWFVWENVPGVLSSNNGRDFAAILSGFRECGYGFAYRILDAQYFGVAQRRRRVFVIGYLGNWRPPAAVLFERESLHGYPAPRRTIGKESARGTGGSPAFPDQNEPIVIDRAAFNQGENAQFAPFMDHDEAVPTLVARGPHAVAARMVAFGEYEIDDLASTIKARDHKDATDLIAFSCKNYLNDALPDCSPTLRAMNSRTGKMNGGGQVAVAYGFKGDQDPILLNGLAVRRLTPRECERLQGFPDDYTLIPVGKNGKLAADSPRYQAMGNSMAVPVMRWIGERIQMYEESHGQA